MARTTIGNWAWAAMLRTSARIDLDQIKEYLEEIHDALDDRVVQFKKHVDGRAQRLDQESREEWYDRNSDEHWKLSDLFPAIFRHSAFVASYSFLEHTLFRACAVLGRENPKTVSMKDLKGEGIELAHVYLKKVQGIRFPDQSAEWNRISDYRKVRNCIVHNDGRVDVKGVGLQIREFVRKNPTLATIDEHNRIFLRREACEDMLVVTRRFLDLVFDEFQSPPGKTSKRKTPRRV